MEDKVVSETALQIHDNFSEELRQVLNDHCLGFTQGIFISKYCSPSE